MRPTIEYRTASKKSYEDFCKKNPSIKISFSKWKEIIYTYNRMCIKYVLETGQSVKLPHGFGRLSINKKKPKTTKKWNGKVYINLPIDWKRTREEGKKVYHLNTHTNGYKCVWIWFGQEARFTNSDVWNFRPSREASRSITKYLNKADKNYIDVYVEWTA
jgi:nucleoid DNA-binding protein